MLIEAINFRALTNHVPHLVAAQQIMMEIEWLHQIIGFDKEIFAKKLQIQALELKKEELDESWTKDLQALHTLVDLNKKRVTGDHIAAFSEFFGRNHNKINLNTFVVDLTSYGNLSRTLSSLYEEIQVQTERFNRLRSYNYSLNQERINLGTLLKSMNDELDSPRNELQGLTSRYGLVGADLVAKAKAKEKEKVVNTVPSKPLINGSDEMEMIPEKKQARHENAFEKLSTTNSSESTLTAVKTAAIEPSSLPQTESESNESGESINGE